MIPLARRVLKQSWRAIDPVKLKSANPLSQFWINDVRHCRELLEQVIDQTERRAVHGDKASASVISDNLTYLVRMGNG